MSLRLDFGGDGPGRDTGAAGEVTRGVARLFDEMGLATITEMRLGSGRRADVMALSRKGHFTIVEVKVSLADLRADRKWPEYLAFCDSFYFAVPPRFPLDALPDEGGVIVADRFGGEIVRRGAVERMAAATRRAQTVRFARQAAKRLRRAEDPQSAL